MHIRTQEELLKPFTRSSSVLEAGLRLYDMSVVEECPYYKKYQYDIHNKGKYIFWPLLLIIMLHIF